MVIFQSRQNLFSKIPWHLLKTRHLVRNSNDRQLFPKNLPYRSLSTITRREIWPELPLGPNFFLRRVSHPFPFFAVHYSSLHFVMARRMLGDLRWHFVFLVLTDFSRWFKRPFARSGVLWITTKYVKHNTLAFAGLAHKPNNSLTGAPVNQLAQ